MLIGVTLGALGGGGSILTVPLLVYALGQDPYSATTSSLLIVGTTSFIALIPHARAQHVRFGQGLLLGVIGTAGSLAGTVASAAVPPQVLLIAFAGLLLVSAVSMLRRSGAAAGDPPEGIGQPLAGARRDRRFWGHLVKVLATATVVGALTGFFGVGGGFLLVPALVLVLGYPMPVAVGTSLLVLSFNSATALAARIFGASGTGSLDWALIGSFTGAAIVGSLLGGRITARVDPAHLTRAFAVLLMAVALYTAARSVPAVF